MGEREVADELLIRRGFLDRIEIDPVQVLHQGLLERLGVFGCPNHCGDHGQACTLRGAPSSFSGDQLVLAVARRAHEDRLQYAELANRSGQRVEIVVGEGLPWLERVRPDGADGQFPKECRTRCIAAVASGRART